jgi:hypothetical protein
MGKTRISLFDPVLQSRARQEEAAVPQSVKWGLLAGIAALCLGAAYLLIERGPAMFLDLGGGLAGCF